MYSQSVVAPSFPHPNQPLQATEKDYTVFGGLQHLLHVSELEIEIFVILLCDAETIEPKVVQAVLDSNSM